MDKNIELRFKNQAKSKVFNNIIDIFGLNKKSVFDIGCSNGEFLIHFGPNSLGITIVQDEVVYGRSKGLNIQRGNIEYDDLSISENSFDVIFANNLLEHLYSPHNFLNKIKKYLKKDGLLILGVPCIPVLRCLLNFNKFRGSLAVSHINFFNKYTLIKTVEKSGWKILNVRGFRFKNKVMDRFLDLIYPHFYVIAQVNHDFKYFPKRMKELIGYNND